LLSTATPEPLDAVVLVDAVVLWVLAVEAGVEAAVELLLLELLLPHPASSAATAAAAPSAREHLTVVPPVAGVVLPASDPQTPRGVEPSLTSIR
jgi:hypothetical protein